MLRRTDQIGFGFPTGEARSRRLSLLLFLYSRIRAGWCILSLSQRAAVYSSERRPIPSTEWPVTTWHVTRLPFDAFVLGSPLRPEGSFSDDQQSTLLTRCSSRQNARLPTPDPTRQARPPSSRPSTRSSLYPRPPPATAPSCARSASSPCPSRPRARTRLPRTWKRASRHTRRVVGVQMEGGETIVGKTRSRPTDG